MIIVLVLILKGSRQFVPYILILLGDLFLIAERNTTISLRWFWFLSAIKKLVLLILMPKQHRHWSKQNIFCSVNLVAQLVPRLQNRTSPRVYYVWIVRKNYTNNALHQCLIVRKNYTNNALHQCLKPELHHYYYNRLSKGGFEWHFFERNTRLSLRWFWFLSAIKNLVLVIRMYGSQYCIKTD